jgi:hypothetical protein
MDDPTSAERREPPASAGKETEGNGAMAVYALGRPMLILAILFSAFVGLFGLFGLVGVINGLIGVVRGHVTGLWAALLGAAFFLGGFFALGWWIPKLLRQLRHPVPYFRIDDQGIECARGRFGWHDIRRVAEVVDSTPRSLVFVLEEETAAQPVDRPYLDDPDDFLGGEASLTPYGLELTISNGAKRARSALASYGHPAVPLKREELSQEDENVPSTTEPR